MPSFPSLPAGNTALHDCAESGSLEILRLLLEHGAKAERDAYGLTPLLAAAVTGHASVVEFLAALPDCPRDQRVEARVQSSHRVVFSRNCLGHRIILSSHCPGCRLF